MGQFIGKYRAVVVDNNDTQNSGQITVTRPGQANNLFDVIPALPCVPAGLLAVPPVGTQVWVEFEEGDDAGSAIWSGVFWIPPNPKPAAVTIIAQSISDISLAGTRLDIAAGSVALNAGLVQASAVLQVDTVTANNVLTNSINGHVPVF